jgi:hypothetical protein
MCQDRESVEVLVKIPADLSCDGREKWKHVGIDRCIAPIVRALQQGGIDMRSSCCGHGRWSGAIVLQDGRTIVVHSAANGTR